MDSQRTAHKVLLADDDHLLRTVLASVLSCLGCEVDEAPDGHVAVEKASAGDHDLIILDVEMPRMNGIEAALRIRKLHPERPLLFVSGLAPDDLEQRTAVVPGAQWLRKPMRLAELQAVVRGLLLIAAAVTLA